MKKRNKLLLKLFALFSLSIICAQTVCFLYFYLTSNKDDPPMVGFNLATELAGKLMETATSQEDLKNIASWLKDKAVVDFWLIDESGRLIFKSAREDAALTISTSESEEWSEAQILEMSGGSARPPSQTMIHLADGRKAHLILIPRISFFRKMEFFLFRPLITASAAAAILVFIVSFIVSAPLSRLHAAVLDMEKGDLTRRVPEAGNDEIGALSRSFNRMAESLEKMLVAGKELTAHLSHELRSPLARIRISLEFLQECIFAYSDTCSNQKDKNLAAFNNIQNNKMEKAPRHALAIEEEIEHMDALIGRILQLSRLDLLPEETRVPCNLGNVIKDLVQRFTPTIKHKGLNLHAEIDESLITYAQENDLFVAFENILDNAVKYSPPGGELQIIGKANIQDGRKINIISIANNCEPLSNEELENIFQPFYRRLSTASTRNAEQSAKTSEKENTSPTGFGLGLTISKRTALKYNCTLEARNSTWGGIVFEMRLPACAKVKLF